MDNEITNVKDLPRADRPRERLRGDGAAALSNMELLAILLGSGSQAIPLLSICNTFISSVNNDAEKLSTLSLEQLREIKGIGESKGMTLIAAFELGRRSMKPGAPLSLKDDELVKTFISPYFFYTSTLQYHFVMMNHRDELLATSEIIVEEEHPPSLKSIIKLCLEAGAASIIICRNDVALPERYLNQEKAFVVQLDAAAAMLKIKMRGLLIV
jgi:DNA repair protein RadC